MGGLRLRVLVRVGARVGLRLVRVEVRARVGI